MEGGGRKGNAWKHWKELLEIQWWGGEHQEVWGWKKWRGMAKELADKQRSKALERHAR